MNAAASSNGFGHSPTPRTSIRSFAATAARSSTSRISIRRSIEPAAGDWRIHFHVPLFTAEYDGLGSTQDDVRRVIDAAAATGVTRHLEIETYTWDVLPAAAEDRPPRVDRARIRLGAPMPPTRQSS